MERPMRHTTPGELFTGLHGPLLDLSWTCNRCDHRAKGAFEWVCLDPERGTKAASSDGILLSRILTCEKCGAVDDYALTTESMLRLTAEMLSIASGNRKAKRLIFGILQLWDGSRVHRPSH